MKILALLVLLMSYMSIRAQQITIDELQSGDLIFVGAQQKGHSEAINSVTQQSSALHYDHVGMVEHSADSCYLLHAATKRGSTRQSLHSYIREHQDQPTLAIYRLRPQHIGSHTINQAIALAKGMLGKPYNWHYTLNDSSYYCSDYIERAFRRDTIFQHIAMTFKTVDSGHTHPFWVGYYQKLNSPIPEGQPGTNPNQLAASPKLQYIGQLILPTEFAKRFP